MGSLIWNIIIGGLCGWLGSKLFKGVGNGIILNVLLGILGGWLGNKFLGSLMGGSFIGELAMGTIGTVAILWIVSLIRGKK